MTTVLKRDYSVHAIKQCKPPTITAEGLLYENIPNLKQLKIFIMICLNAISFLYPTQLVMPSVVAIAVKKLMAI